MNATADLVQVEKLRPGEMNLLAEDNATSQLEVRMRIKMQRGMRALKS